MNSLDELEDKNELDDGQKKKLKKALTDFNSWLQSTGVVKKTFNVKNIVFEPFSNEDWIMKVREEKGKKIASFNPIISKNCSYEFLEIVILHEFFHLGVQEVPNKDDATKIKDDFGSDFMSLIDIEADFYVAKFLKEKKRLTHKKYWELYFEGSKIFIDKWIRNKKFERFIGSILTIHQLFHSIPVEFDLYLPSISPVFTQDKISVLIIKREHIAFQEINARFEDLRSIKKLYIKPDHHTFDGYYQSITEFAEHAFN